MKKYYEIQSNIENGRIYEAKCDKKDIKWEIDSNKWLL